MPTPEDGVVSLFKEPESVIKCHAYQKGSIVHALQGMPCASLSLLHGGFVQVGQKLHQVVQPLCHGKYSTRLSFTKSQNVCVCVYLFIYFILVHHSCSQLSLKKILIVWKLKGF